MEKKPQDNKNKKMYKNMKEFWQIKYIYLDENS